MPEKQPPAEVKPATEGAAAPIPDLAPRTVEPTAESDVKGGEMLHDTAQSVIRKFGG